MDIPILHTATVLAGMEHPMEMSHNPYGTDLSLGHEYGNHPHQQMVHHQQHQHLHQHHHQDYQHDIQDTMLQTPNPQMPPHIPMTQSMAVTQPMAVTQVISMSQDSIRMEMSMPSADNMQGNTMQNLSTPNEAPRNEYVELYQKNQAEEAQRERERERERSAVSEDSEPTAAGRPAEKRSKKPMKFIKLKHQFNCKICGFTTMNKEFAEKHKHENLKDLACVIKESPEGHKKCPYCQYMNKSMKSLRQHMNLHLKEKPFKCEQCLFLTSEKRELMMHEAVHHALNERKRKRRKKKGKIDDEELTGKKKRRRRKKKKGKGNEEDDEKPKKKKKRKLMNIERPPRAIESVCQIKRLSKINLTFKCKVCGFTTPNKFIMDEHEHVKNKETAFPLPQKLLAQITNLKKPNQTEDSRPIDDNRDKKPGIPHIEFVAVPTDEDLEENTVTEGEDNKVVIKKIVTDNDQVKKEPAKVIKPTKAKHIVRITETADGIKKCPYCDFGNKNIQRLKIHIRSHIVKKIKCNKCKFQAVDMNEMIQHQAIHTKKDLSEKNDETQIETTVTTEAGEKTIQANKESDPISAYDLNENQEETENNEEIDHTVNQSNQDDQSELSQPVQNESQSYNSIQPNYENQYNNVIIYSCQECSFKGDINLFEQHKLIHNKNPVYTPL